MSRGQKIEKNSFGNVTETFETVNPNNELPVILSTFSLNVES